MFDLLDRQFFCDHEWEQIQELYSYVDYSCYMVHVIQCRCSKCGKIKNRKFY